MLTSVGPANAFGKIGNQKSTSRKMMTTTEKALPSSERVIKGTGKGLLGAAILGLSSIFMPATKTTAAELQASSVARNDATVVSANMKTIFDSLGIESEFKSANSPKVKNNMPSFPGVYTGEPFPEKYYLEKISNPSRREECNVIGITPDGKGLVVVQNKDIKDTGVIYADGKGGINIIGKKTRQDFAWSSKKHGVQVNDETGKHVKATNSFGEILDTYRGTFNKKTISKIGSASEWKATFTDTLKKVVK